MPRMEMGKIWTWSLRAAVCAAFAGAMLVAQAGHAYAEDDDDDDLTFEQKLIRNMLGGLGAAGTGSAWAIPKRRKYWN